MKALVSRSPKTPLTLEELPDRPLGRRELRVDVRAIGVNPVDYKMRDAGNVLGFAQRLIGRSPFVCGVDFAGVVSEVAPDAQGVKVGDRVVGGANFARRQHGSYASAVQVRDDQIAVLPDAVSFEAAACLPVAGVTAQISLVELGGLDRRVAAGAKPRVLVLGASGGVGHFAIQLARLHGGSAVGVCSARNLALVERLGARAIDYGQGDPLAAAAADGRFDIIVDAAGTTAYPLARRGAVLAPGATQILVMPRPGDYWRIALPGSVRTVLGEVTGARLQPLVAALAAGTLEVVIAERFPLAEAERAHAVSQGGRVVGKLVLIA